VKLLLTSHFKVTILLVSKNLEDADLKIVLLNYQNIQNNYVKNLSAMNNVKSF